VAIDEERAISSLTSFHRSDTSPSPRSVAPRRLGAGPNRAVATSTWPCTLTLDSVRPDHRKPQRGCLGDASRRAASPSFSRSRSPRRARRRAIVSSAIATTWPLQGLESGVSDEAASVVIELVGHPTLAGTRPGRARGSSAA